MERGGDAPPLPSLETLMGKLYGQVLSLRELTVDPSPVAQTRNVPATAPTGVV
jgi:hypothetical protein